MFINDNLCSKHAIRFPIFIGTGSAETSIYDVRISTFVFCISRYRMLKKVSGLVNHKQQTINTKLRTATANC